jgi:NAD(P)-dependent dehydrogenase (short-subunit alcohol dehydrogenase family)
MADSDPDARISELKTVLITGATDGLGKATALMLARNGYRVFASGRDGERRALLTADAMAQNLPLETLEMDVTSDESVARALDEIHSKAGPIDILINNAGIGIIAAMEEISLADLHKQFETNFYGVVRVTQRVLPDMRSRQRGRIVNMSSVSGIWAVPLFGPYSSSKFALEAISDAWRLELASFGVRVILIEPAYIPTSMADRSRTLSASYLERPDGPYTPVYSSFLKRWRSSTAKARAVPDDCARVILRALRDSSPRARYTVTGEARVASLLKRLLTDRARDRMILMILKRFGNR